METPFDNIPIGQLVCNTNTHIVFHMTDKDTIETLMSKYDLLECEPSCLSLIQSRMGNTSTAGGCHLMYYSVGTFVKAIMIPIIDAVEEEAFMTGRTDGIPSLESALILMRPYLNALYDHATYYDLVFIVSDRRMYDLYCGYIGQIYGTLDTKQWDVHIRIV